MRNLGILLLIAAMLPAAAHAAAPEVTNVAFAQRTDGSMVADVTYDAFDADGDTLAVSLYASIDGGVSWEFPALHVSGDVGKGVLPGTGKNIVWDLAADLPDREGLEVQVRVVASDSGTLMTPHSPDLYAIIDWQYIDWTEPGIYDRYAKADLLVLTSNAIWGHDNWEQRRIFDNIRAINPDIVIVGYVLSKTVLLSWADPARGNPFERDLFEATRPYWCFTTTGDTLQDWWNQVNVNILEPECRAGITNTIATYQNTSNNRFDGVFWDYFAFSLWWPTHDLFEGEPDLDGDGIAHHDDSDEIAAFKRACEDLVLETRAALGEDFVQIFNGPRAQRDKAFAGLSDGIHYELFPNQQFPSPYYAGALDPELSYSLFHTATWPRSEAGGPFVITSIIWQNFYNDPEDGLTLLDLGNTNRVVGLLTDTYTSWNSHGEYSYGWPEVDIPLGEPLGPTVIDYPHYTREFEFGRVEMEMKNGTYPDPFRYTIYVNGEVVESFDLPFRYP